jgi:hypothetical protein
MDKFVKWLFNQAWYAEFLIEIDLKILLRKTRARLNLKIEPWVNMQRYADPKIYLIFYTKLMPILRLNNIWASF